VNPTYKKRIGRTTTRSFANDTPLIQSIRVSFSERWTNELLYLTVRNFEFPISHSQLNRTTRYILHKPCIVQWTSSIKWTMNERTSSLNWTKLLIPTINTVLYKGISPESLYLLKNIPCYPQNIKVFIIGRRSFLFSIFFFINFF
jgi:hypothetical protein